MHTIRRLRAAAAPTFYMIAMACYARASTLWQSTRFSAALSIGAFSVELSHRQKPKVKNAWITAFEEAIVHPGETKHFDLHPQLFYKIRKIVSTGEVEGLYVRCFLIGQKLQTPAMLPIPLVAFAPHMLNDVDFETCPPGITVTIQVLNKSESPKKFSMVMSGDAVF